MEEVTKYKATDGTIFEDKYFCIEHESNIKLSIELNEYLLEEMPADLQEILKTNEKANILYNWVLKKITEDSYYIKSMINDNKSN